MKTREQMIDEAVRETHVGDESRLIYGVLMVAELMGTEEAEANAPYSVPAIRRAFLEIAARESAS